MGWIFFKPSYERINLIDRDDLDRDPGKFLITSRQLYLHYYSRLSCALSTQILWLVDHAVFKHKLTQNRFKVPLALFFGFAVPPLIGLFWGDPIGSFIWGGLASRLASECSLQYQ